MFTRRPRRRSTVTTRNSTAKPRRLGFETLEARLPLVGDFQSAYQLATSQLSLEVFDTAYDSVGNLYVGGQYQNSTNFDPTNSPGAPYNDGLRAGYLAKYNTSGVLQWVHSFDASSDSVVTALTVDSNDNVIITGWFRGSQDFDFSAGTSTLTTVNTSTDNVFVAKYASNNALVWAVAGTTTSTTYGRDVATDSSGNIYAVGQTYGTLNGQTNAGDTDAFVWKLSSTGTTQWTNLAGGTLTDDAYTVDVNAGRIVVGGFFWSTITFDTGFTASSQGGGDAYVWVLDTAGATQWSASAGSSMVSNDSVRSVVIDSTGKVFAHGQLMGTADMDPGAGTTSLNTGSFMWQLNSGGTFAAASTTKWQTFNLDAITRGPNGDMYIAARMSGTTDIDWGTGVRNLTDSTGGSDYVLLRYDPQGQLSGATQITSTNVAPNSAVAVNAVGQIAYLVVANVSTVDLNPGTGTQEVTAGSENTLYLINLQESVASVNVSATTMSENAGTSTVRVSLDRTRSEDVTINLGFSGSATLNVDYSASTNSLVILAGQTSGSITLTAINDSAHEVGETIVVNIASLYGARAGTSSQVSTKLIEEKSWHLGDLVSTKHLAATGDLIYAVDAANDASGNLFIAGTMLNGATVNFAPGASTSQNVTAGSFYNGFIAKYNTNGDVVWKHALGGGATLTVTGAQLDSQGNWIIAGHVDGVADFDPSGATVNLGNGTDYASFVAKYSPTGTLIWAKEPAATPGNQATALAVGPTDEIYVTGRSSGTFEGQASAGNNDAFVWKLAANGTTQWSRLVGGTGSDRPWSIDVNASGTIVVGGDFQGSATFAPGFAATAAGASDMFVWELNSAGTTQWVTTAGSNSAGSDEKVTSVVIDDQGRVTAIATLLDTADMDPGTDTVNVGSGTVIWKLNSDGTLASAASTPSADRLFLGANGDVYITGSVFAGTHDFDLGAGTVSVTDVSAPDYVLARYDSAGNLTGLSQWKTQDNPNSGAVLAFNTAGQLDVIMTAIVSSVDLDPGAGTQTFSASPGAHIVRVRLQEVAASVAMQSVNLAENAGTSTVRVTLDHTHSEPVTVDLSFGGSATLGIDYSASSNSLVIPAGQTSGSITLTALNDSAYEGSESITISIVSTYGALENGTQQATASIVDDDPYLLLGATLMIFGTEANDHIGLVRVGPNSFYTSFNGALTIFYGTTISQVLVSGQGGWDYFAIQGANSIAETVSLGPQSLLYLSMGLTVQSNTEQNVAFGQGDDSATYTDSAASDIIYMLPAYSIMYSVPSIDYISWTVGFGTTTANADAGSDNLLFYGTTGPQTTFMTPTQTTLTTGSVTITANNFESQFSYGQSDDTVNLTDSSGNDNYFRLPAYGVLSTATGIQEPIGFGNVIVNSTGGQDSAILFESSGVDTYTGNATQAQYQTILETTTFNNFRSIYIHGAANDTVTLNDSSGGDVFYGGANQSTLIYASGRSHQVLGAQSITLSGNNGGFDYAFLDDSSGDDVLSIDGLQRIRLQYAGSRTIAVAAFDAVYARGTSGGRNTRTPATLSYPGINFSGSWV